MSPFLEMDVVRERGGSLYGSEVESGMRMLEMRNGLCRNVPQNGATLKAIVRRGSARSDRRYTG